MRLNSKALIIVIFLLLFVSLQCQEAIKPGINFLKSAVVPGWGQLSLHQSYGWFYLVLETGLWSMNYYYNSESDSKAEASIKYACKYGHVNPEGDYSEKFYEDMRSYMSSGYEEGGYNAHIARKAADLYPDDVEAQQEYINRNTYSEDQYWKWDCPDNKREYSVYRKRIEQYSDNLKVLGGALAANHIVSAFDALRLSNHLKRVKFGVTYNSDKTPLLNLTYKF